MRCWRANPHRKVRVLTRAPRILHLFATCCRLVRRRLAWCLQFVASSISMISDPHQPSVRILQAFSGHPHSRLHGAAAAVQGSPQQRVRLQRRRRAAGGLEVLPQGAARAAPLPKRAARDRGHADRHRAQASCIADWPAFAAFEMSGIHRCLNRVCCCLILCRGLMPSIFSRWSWLRRLSRSCASAGCRASSRFWAASRTMPRYASSRSCAAAATCSSGLSHREGPYRSRSSVSR